MAAALKRGLILAVMMAGAALALPQRPPALQGVSAAAAPAEEKPFGLSKRIPWTTSKVVGSPEPPPPYRVRRTFPNLKVVYPIAVAHEPGTENLLLVHQLVGWVGAGRILRVKGGGAADQAEVLLSFDRTIYGLAFHPDFLKNGYIFVGANGPVDANDEDVPGKRFKPEVVKTTRISRFTVDRQLPHRCDPKSEKVIIEWPSNGHNGGDLAFGPDGMLYITSGDGTSDSDTNLAGQNLTHLLAKVLRIDVDHPPADKPYAVPKDNPFVNMKDVRPETWAYGFRNPWRLHIDRKSGDIWVGNNGQDLWEQLYLVERGANYGWSVVEGSHPFYPQRKQGPTPISKPFIEHSHAESRSLTGGLVYTGSKLPDLRGAYLYGDWSTGKIWGVRHDKGKITWHKELADTTLQITGFGLDSKGELLIVDWGSGIYQLEPSPRETASTKFPDKLSETGLFVSVKDHRPDPALIPYSVNAPLWSDGADKERFIALPGTSQIDFTTERGWNFPDGTVLVKTFSLNLGQGDLASKRRIETRLLTRQQGKWAGYSYLWNDEQTEATLVASAGMDKLYAIADAQAPGGRRQQKWHYPSRAECMVCHSRAANFVLGPSVLQMNKDHDYGGVIDNQLRALEHIGVFRVNQLEHFQQAKKTAQGLRKPVRSLLGTIPESLIEKALAKVPFIQQVGNAAAAAEKQLGEKATYTARLLKRPAQYPRLADPYDAKTDLNARARSYLHANCSQCHVLAGGGNAMIDLEFNTAAGKMQLFGVRPQHDSFKIADAALVTPGHPERSVLLQRMDRRGAGQMPPLATAEIDRAAIQLLDEWIKQLK
jgi:glucose/arabinose dehydrogenase/mono/diheme cytochrome c family protein